MYKRQVYSEAINDALPYRGFHKLPGFEKQAAARYGVKDAGPESDDGVIHLAQVVEATEGDPARAQRRQEGDVNGCIRGGETESRFGQPPDLLGEIAFFAGRQGPGVGNQVVDLGHAGGGKITEPGHLYRRRFPGEHGKPVVRRVPGEIDEDVDLSLIHI